MTTLNYMSKRNRQNTLATWVNQGGQLWATGGGFGNATNTSWNMTANDNYNVRTYTTLTSAAAPNPDLGPGRFMYDLSHWRSEFRIFQGFVDFARTDLRDPTSTNPLRWPGEPLRDPRYEFAPQRLQPRTPTTDPLSLVPFRTNSTYYVGNVAYSNSGFCIEYMTYENFILETEQATPDSSYEFAALDTLYNVYGTRYSRELLQAGSGVNAVITYYHGKENGTVLFQGCALWDFQRTQCQQFVDFVLGQLWGMPKNGAAVRSAARVQRASPTVSGSTTTRAVSTSDRSFRSSPASPPPTRSTDLKRWR
jgi:hypothetical protein